MLFVFTAVSVDGVPHVNALKFTESKLHRKAAARSQDARSSCRLYPPVIHYICDTHKYTRKSIGLYFMLTHVHDNR